MEFLICAKAFFKIPINGRMRAENWMKAGCMALLPSVEVAMQKSLVFLQRNVLLHVFEM